MHKPPTAPTTIGIIGAGPAGLTAAYLLTKAGYPVTVFEADDTYVGGISRTARYKGFLFDIGGHRFFSKAKPVEDLWNEILPDDFLDRPRSSRIYYNHRFFSYPLKAVEALFKLGVLESVLCVLSYAHARLRPVKAPRNFEQWVVNQFGRRLFNIFFKTYTEKVWGMKCTEISADWAAQRIKGLSLSAAIINALTPGFLRNRGPNAIKTLIDSFRYPRKGPGMMWERCAQLTQAKGGKIVMGATVHGCALGSDGRWQLAVRKADGSVEHATFTHVISSAPIRELVSAIIPPVAAPVLAAANSLRYRDFLTVVVMLKDRDLFRDNWIYIHDPSVKVGRIQNFKSWSPEMIPDPTLCCYGLEYFCFEGDGLWTSTDGELLDLAKRELESIGLAKGVEITDGCVVRQKKAYPVYDEDYARHVGVIRQELDRRYQNLHLVGRNGMHKYNNQDHAMMTAMLCVENIKAGKQVYDLWEVNQDAEYHEAGGGGTESSISGLRAVPQAVAKTATLEGDAAGGQTRKSS